MPVLESDRPVCRENRTESTSWAKVSLKRNEMNKVLLDRYLCPEHFVDFQLIGQLSDDPGYFRFGPTRPAMEDPLQDFGPIGPTLPSTMLWQM